MTRPLQPHSHVQGQSGDRRPQRQRDLGRVSGKVRCSSESNHATAETVAGEFLGLFYYSCRGASHGTRSEGSPRETGQQTPEINLFPARLNRPTSSRTFPWRMIDTASNLSVARQAKPIDLWSIPLRPDAADTTRRSSPLPLGQQQSAQPAAPYCPLTLTRTHRRPPESGLGQRHDVNSAAARLCLSERRVRLGYPSPAGIVPVRYAHCRPVLERL